MFKISCCFCSDFDKNQPKDGTLAQLLSGYCGETINSTISRLYRKADFDLDKASRGIVFLDGMQKIGQNQGLSKREQQQVLREILQIVEGTTPIDVTRAGSTSIDREVLDTSKMFFICFGVFEAEEQLLNQDFEEEGYEEDFEILHQDHDNADFKILDSTEHNNHNNNNNVVEKDLNERRDSRTSTMSMDTTSSTCSERSSSNTSSEKSPENCKPHNNKTSQKLTRRKDEFTCTKKLSNNNPTKNNNKVVVKSNESDVSSSIFSNQDDFDYWYNADDSFQGLKENKLARLMTEAENSPIPHYQMLWGMKDVDLKFNPEALEIIANQVIGDSSNLVL